MVSVDPSILTSCPILALPITAITSPTPKPVKKAIEASSSASFLFPAPIMRAIKLPVPIPIINASAWIMAMAEKITPTAPEALVPNWLTNQVSTILYRFVISMLMVVGSPSSRISRATGSSVSRLYCFSSFVKVISFMFPDSYKCHRTFFHAILYLFIYTII